MWSLRAWRFAFPASVMSRLGDLMFDLTVVLWIGVGIAPAAPWAPAAVSGVLMAAAGTTLVAGPIAGVVVDRSSGQRVIQIANVVQFVTMGSLVIPASGLLAPSTPVLLAWIYAVVLASNSAGQFYTQARTAMIATTIPEKSLVSAFSAQSGASSVLSLVAPAAAAPLYFAVGPAVSLGLNAATFAASSILHSMFTWERPTKHDFSRESFLTSLRDGLVAVGKNKALLSIVGLISIATLGSGIVSVLELFFLTDVLGAPAENLGWMNAAFAAGTFAGILFAPKLAKRFGAGRILLCGLAASGILIAVYSINHVFAVAAILYVAIAVPLGMINVVLPPLAISLVPPELLGRSMAAVNVLPSVAGLVAMGGAGWLASGPLAGLDIVVGPVAFGPINTLFLACGLLFVAAVLVTSRAILQSHSN